MVKEISPERKNAILESIGDISSARKSYFLMLILSAVIATYGLLANSTAVVIGAMLVAPLMGPIFGIALGLSIGDSGLLRKAASSEVLGVLLGIAVATCIGFLPWRMEFGAEITARVQPTLYDLIIALASGLAGAYALVDEKVSPSLPGVAIATSLVPPLATCGLCLSAGKWQFALGAFLLFFANFLAIELAAAFVFILSGMMEAHPHKPYTAKTFLRQFAPSIIALVIVAIFMTKTLIAIVQIQHMKEGVTDILSHELRSSRGAHLTDIRYDQSKKPVLVIASVLTPREFTPEQVAAIEGVLRERVDPQLRLIIRSILSRDADRNGIVFVEESELQRREKEREDVEKEHNRIELRNKITATVNEQLKNLLGAQLEDIRYEAGEKEDTVIATVDTPAVIDPSQVKEVEKSLQKELARPVRLIVRSVLTRDADSGSFLYEDRFLTDASAIIQKELKRIPGAELVNVRREIRGKTVFLYALVSSPHEIGPAEVKVIETVLQEDLGEFVRLIVRSVIARDVDSKAFLYTKSIENKGKKKTPKQGR